MCSVKPFISADKYGEKAICLICEKDIFKNDTAYQLSNISWKAFTGNAKKWSEIDFPLDDERHTYANVYSKVVNNQNPFGVIHDGCRITFGTLINRYQKKYGFATTSNEDEGK